MPTTPMPTRAREVGSGTGCGATSTSEIAYIDSQGLRLLKQLSDRLSSEDTTLQLIAPPGKFARGVLELTLLDKDVEVLDA